MRRKEDVASNPDRLTGITHVKGGSTTIASVAYTLDDVGNRTQSFPKRMDQQGTHTYQYDDLYRLTSVTYPGPSTTSYAFDAFGNCTSMTVAGNTTTYAYDDNDRITSVTPPSPASVINSDQICGNLLQPANRSNSDAGSRRHSNSPLHHTEPALG